MEYENKTKMQLIGELMEMRQRIAELESSRLEDRQSGKELRDSAKHMGILFECAPDAYYLSDLKGNFVDGNRIAEETVGYKREELIGKSFLKAGLLSPKQIPKAAALLARNALGQPTGPDVLTLKRKDGSKVAVEIRTFPVRIGDRPLILGIARDITHRKQREEELRKYRTHLEELVEERTLELTKANVELQREIIERRRAEEALREIEGQNQALLRAIPDLMLRVSQDGTILGFVDSKDMILFIPSDGILGKRIDEVFPTEEAHPATDHVKQALQTGETQISEHQIPDPSPGGGMRDYEVRYVASGKGEVLAIVRDVTDHKQAEEALRKVEKEKAAILGSISEQVIYQDIQMVILWANRAAAESADLTSERLVGRHCYEIWQQRDQPCVGCPIRKALETGKPQESEMTSTDGRMWLIKGYPLRNADGDITGIVEIALDITKHKRTEESLATEKERLAVTLRSIGDGVIATDTEGKVVLINRIAETLTGWREKDAVGKPLAEIFHIINENTRERCKNPLEKVIVSRGITDLADDLSNDVVLVSKDGEERIITDSAAPIRDKDGKIIGMILVFSDITEERKIEEELVKVQKLESVGVLAGGIAHDFNNILTGILGNISLARIYTDPRKIAERLAEAEKASIRAQDLTQRLLTFSRGGAPIRKTASMAELLKDSANFAISGSNIICQFSLADGLWPVEIDEGQMNQVISNLIVNADQAMPEGGIVEVRAENIAVGSEDALPVKGGKYVKISIEDHGVGIAKEHLPKIFDPYFTTKQKGSGLGLATSYSIVRNHDGHIMADSKVGVGTTFFIYLPASSQEMPAEEAQNEKDPAMGKGRILIMDDEELIRELAGNTLSNVGYAVAVATEGVEAIELYKNAKASDQPFDLVILDLTVPGGLGGKEAIQELIQLDPEVKAIASSGYSNDPVIADFRKFGFSGAIAKPYRAEELSRIIHEVMEM